MSRRPSSILVLVTRTVGFYRRVMKALLAALLIVVSLLSCGCDFLPMRHGIGFTVAVQTNQLSSTPPDVAQVGEQIRKRIDQLGYKCVVNRVGDSRLYFRLPKRAERDVASIREAMVRGGLLEFRLVHPQNEAMLRDGIVPAGYVKLAETRVGPSGEKTRIDFLVSKQAVAGVSGQNIDNAAASKDPLGNPEIMVRFDQSGSAAFSEITRENVGKFLAIVIDGQLYSAPRIVQPIAGGAGRITGAFTMREAQLLSVLLRTPLPASTKIVEEQTF